MSVTDSVRGINIVLIVKRYNLLIFLYLRVFWLVHSDSAIFLGLTIESSNVCGSDLPGNHVMSLNRPEKLSRGTYHVPYCDNIYHLNARNPGNIVTYVSINLLRG